MSFTVYAKYYSHKQTHIEEKKFNCALCEKKFTTKTLLRLHVATHTSEKKHMCEFCGKQFKYLQSLSVHKRRGHGDSPKVKNTAVGMNFNVIVESKLPSNKKTFICYFLFNNR